MLWTSNRRWLPLTLLFLSLGACHVTPRPHEVAWDHSPPDEQRDQLVADAQQLRYARRFQVGPKRFPYDCSGYVAAVLYQSGIDVYGGATQLQIRGNGVRLLNQYLIRYGTLFKKRAPKPGDLVFFSNTYDLNRDGKINDKLTHIGIVERVDRDGTVTFLHTLNRRVKRHVLNLEKAGHHRKDRKVVNDYLRRRRRGDPKGTGYLTGQLFSGYGSIVK